MDLSSLDDEVYHFAQSSIANSTKRTYRTGLNRYLSFCQEYNVATPLPASESMLCYFVVALARRGLTPGTIKTYLAAVRHAQIVEGLPDIRQTGLPRLKLVQTGVRRVHAFQAPQQHTRLPITPELLNILRQVWLRPPASFDGIMFWAAASACFFGFFRAGEITVPSAASFDPAVHLAWGDVSTDSVTTPSKVRVHLKRSKTDQFGGGVDVFVGKTGDEVCPVRAIASYAAARGNAPGPFFQSSAGSPLTKARFVEAVRQALQQAGVPSEGYAGHSFRIGAATTAARAGLQDSTIQALGRWSSSAFLRYIRTTRDELAAFSSSLATAQSTASHHH